MYEYTGNTPPQTQDGSKVLELTFTVQFPERDLEKVRSIAERLAQEVGGFALPGAVDVRFAEPAPKLAELVKQYKLSDREVEVARLVADGKENSEIGQRLGLSAATVKGYVSTALQKTRCHNRADLTHTLFGKPFPDEYEGY